MSVFERIKQLAEKRGMSVSKVASELGFSENLFYQWKKSSPKSDRLEKVADFFGVSVDYLLGRTDNPSTNDEEIDPLTYYRMQGNDFTEEEKKEIRKQIEFAEKLAMEQIRRRKKD